ncbi:glucose-1-phosphate adenylyltransferase subunit GlgD [Cuneatibacter sp. NSJ-177]|uniref:glucose-1-phosphate adenylyltransferase subunit GlgD n=1 Tax=Cuneatibacter sp. NSJ-177 TaxID=2931401 RepID=UPI001FD1FA34|nr:glucose-1-phosphate adenylyltransferase subunit GlgD [Cuneatibacter sp. NSJ-177]MCJ7834654.1 glucose-1-phosphate adenylyltransferase subunit GlgD [Cuneatibacter sp. NSJ-177]
MKALGIILAGGNGRRMRELSNKRAVAAMPVAGSYRAIDFVLSNMTNSQIGKVAVITQYSSRSLNEHLSSSKWWDFGRKQGGLFVFNPTITPQNNEWYRGTADALAQNLNFLRDSHEPYVVIAPGDGVYKVDYNKVIEYHMQKEADITVVCKKLPAGTDVSRFGVVELDEDMRITGFEEKPVISELNTVSCGIYIIRRRLLISLLEQCEEMEWFDFVRDVLMRQRKAKRIYAYNLKGYWANIATVDAFYQCNMDFLKPEVRQEFFYGFPEIYTKVDDNPPAKFNPGSFVENSLVASGTIINGTIKDSVIFKKVFVGGNCHIRNCIILNDVSIGDGVALENCIVESRTKIMAGTQIKGEEGAVRIVTH